MTVSCGCFRLQPLLCPLHLTPLTPFSHIDRERLCASDLGEVPRFFISELGPLLSQWSVTMVTRDDSGWCLMS